MNGGLLIFLRGIHFSRRAYWVEFSRIAVFCGIWPAISIFPDLLTIKLQRADPRE